MLREIKNNRYHYHYYEDDQGRFQGEYKWWDDGQLRQHCFYKDGDFHGEFKWLKLYDELIHEFYQNNEDITYAVKALVEDINNITKEERMMIKLKFGIECLC